MPIMAYFHPIPKDTKMARPANNGKSSEAHNQAPDMEEYNPPVAGGVSIEGVTLPENVNFAHYPSTDELVGRPEKSIWLKGRVTRVFTRENRVGETKQYVEVYAHEYLGHAIPGKGLKCWIGMYIQENLEDFYSEFDLLPKEKKRSVNLALRLDSWREGSERDFAKIKLLTNVSVVADEQSEAKEAPKAGAKATSKPPEKAPTKAHARHK